MFQPSPWQTAGAAGLLPTPGPNQHQPRGADFMQAGNLLGSLIGGNSGQGAFAGLARQLAMAQAAIQAPPAPRFNDTMRMRVSSRFEFAVLSHFHCAAMPPSKT